MGYVRRPSAIFPPRHSLACLELLADLLTLWCRYGDHNMTEAEWNSLPVREQERVRRANMTNQMNANPTAGWNQAYFSPPAMNSKNFRRADWLKDKMSVHNWQLLRLLTHFITSFFDGLEQDDDYSAKRLGFKAPNVFIMSFCS
jgi:hypothetical protein